MNSNNNNNNNNNNNTNNNNNNNNNNNSNNNNKNNKTNDNNEVTVLLCSISFWIAFTYLFIVCWLFPGVHFLFLFCLNSLLSSPFLSFVVSLKYAVSLIHLKSHINLLIVRFLL